MRPENGWRRWQCGRRKLQLQAGCNVSAAGIQYNRVNKTNRSSRGFLVVEIEFKFERKT